MLIAFLIECNQHFLCFITNFQKENRRRELTAPGNKPVKRHPERKRKICLKLGHFSARMVFPMGLEIMFRHIYKAVT